MEMRIDEINRLHSEGNYKELGTWIAVILSLFKFQRLDCSIMGVYRNFSSF